MIKMKKNSNLCCTSTEPCIRSRRCFMTGEYCSKQPNIQRERKKLHDNKNEKKTFRIRAFVIMNFSDMADVVYKWRIRPFIESLSKYLYIENEKLYCGTVERNDSDNPLIEVEVVRSDSDPASNYVICSRICQQMQIADLVIVDVSNQNANVFYEFGMAVALGKMILPICYSESFYKMVPPETLREDASKQLAKTKEITDIEHHIGFYPWRKSLFEYYGIRYRTSESKTEYLDYDIATNPKYGFSDLQYCRFPYHEILSLQENEAVRDSQNNTSGIGQQIYEKLRKEYNEKKSQANTLIVYTMDAFLNEEEAGLCIVNFYNKIVSKMKEENCFCGERVGVLVQESVIPETEKDAREDLDIEYSVGEIIQIGTNQATYLAAEEKIKSDDKWPDSLGYDPDGKLSPLPAPTLSQKQGIERFVKKHITNRAMRIYPNNPVFVDRMKNLLHKDLLNQYGEDGFYLYYVMLRTLRYTNEIVVDISTNCLQSLFWLGAAHGSDIYAITVMHEKTSTEKQYDAQNSIKENRYIFDVAGLWTAILRKNDTEGFYMQLAAAQSGIERHSKLMLSNIKYYKNQLKEYLFSFHEISSDKRSDPASLGLQKKEEEDEILESYYRDRFWAPMLSYNQLSLYLSHINDVGGNDDEPRLLMSKWDFLAVSLLSHYLSKRKLIGEYSLISLAKDETDHKAEMRNFICIGSEVKPLGRSLPEVIYEKIKDAKSPFEKIDKINIIHKRHKFFGKFSCTTSKSNKIFKGFLRKADSESTSKGIFTHHPATKTCAKCINLTEPFNKKNIHIFYDSNEISADSSCQFNSGEHIEIAQLILWRDTCADSDLENYFRVGIIGCSGPATSALSLLFVDEEEIKTLLVENEEYTTPCKDENKLLRKSGNLLCELQRLAREKFMEIFLMQLHKMLMEKIKEFTDTPANIDEQKEKYYALVRYAVVFYLKTVLYRYFFPFLSEADIERIYNGMYTFINSMKAARISPFSLNYHANGSQSVVKDADIEEITNSIPLLLRKSLKNFRGLEAFYKVEVIHSLEDPAIEKDTRRIKKIELLKKDEEAQINYLFL